MSKKKQANKLIMQRQKFKFKLNYLGILSIVLLTGAIACGSKGKPNIAADSTTQPKQVASTIIVDAQLSGTTRNLSPNFTCFNVNSVQIESWQRPEFLAAVNRIKPATLRIPGGDVGNYWDWQRGGLIEDISILPDGLPFFLRFRARQYTASKLTDYQAGLQGTKTKPIFMLNMLTSSLQSQLAMLRSARDLGITVEFIELGNEFYFNINNYKQVFPTPQEYALQASQWIAAIEQEFPQARISVLGVVPEPDKPERLQLWNQTVLNSALPAADAITLHIYPDTGLTSEPERTTYPWFEASEVPIILGEPFRNWQNLRNDRNFKIIPRNKRIWVTEYNLFEDLFPNGTSNPPEPRVAGSWTHGLYNLAMSLLFLEESRIELACNHSLLESSIFGAILANDKSFVNPANPNMTSEPLSLSATGRAMSLFYDAATGMRRAEKINFSSNASLTGKDGFTYPSLSGWKFTRSRQEKAILVNFSDTPQTVRINTLFNRTVRYRSLSGSPLSLVNQTGVLTEDRGRVTDSIALPPYSVIELF
jgi:hypothetical protein